MFLNGGHVLSPDVHPDTLVLPQLPQSDLAVGGGGVGLAVLLLPGLKQSGEENVLLVRTGGQISPPSPPAGPWRVAQPGPPPGRTEQTRRASSWCGVGGPWYLGSAREN